MGSNPVYETLIGCDNGAFSEYGKVAGRPQVASRRSGCCERSAACRTAVIALMLLATLGAAGVSGWSCYRLYSGNRGACAYVRFILDTDSMPACGWPAFREPPCLVNATKTAATYLSSGLYNNALGPWKAAEASGSSNGDGGGGECGIRLTRRGTHLQIEKSGLYQLSAQVTFAENDGRVADLVWQVNHAEWIALDKSAGVGGPTHAYLSAVRRLQAGQKVSLHLRQAPRTIGAEPGRTQIVLSML